MILFLLRALCFGLLEKDRDTEKSLSDREREAISIKGKVQVNANIISRVSRFARYWWNLPTESLVLADPLNKPTKHSQIIIIIINKREKNRILLSYCASVSFQVKVACLGSLKLFLCELNIYDLAWDRLDIYKFNRMHNFCSKQGLQ